MFYLIGLLIMLSIICAFTVGQLYGYLQGVIDVTTMYRLDDIENVLNISKNVSDYVISEVIIK